jgi:hypothetical protein
MVRDVKVGQAGSLRGGWLLPLSLQTRQMAD